jgi:hypothetical protein
MSFGSSVPVEGLFFFPEKDRIVVSMRPKLLVLAAGMGSRFGSSKQVEAVGPCGETILEYSIYDALTEGFDEVLFVIRRETEGEFREKVVSRLPTRVPFRLVFQELDSAIEEPLRSAAIASGRTKPWGTGHAVLCSASELRAPFAAINADDFYGRGSFRAVGAFLASVDPRSASWCMAGFRLANTTSPNGPVARGLCEVDAEGRLVSVVEHLRVEEAPASDRRGHPGAASGRAVDGPGAADKAAGSEAGSGPGVADKAAGSEAGSSPGAADKAAGFKAGSGPGAAAPGIAYRSLLADDTAIPLSGSEVVSMNFWGFTPVFFDLAAGRFREFAARELAAVPDGGPGAAGYGGSGAEARGAEARGAAARGAEARGAAARGAAARGAAASSAEFYLPELVGSLAAEGRALVRVIPTPEPWFGLTYMADLAAARYRIAKLTAAGLYPSPLWGEG